VKAIIIFAALLLSGCASMTRESVVYGASGRVFTAPDFNVAWYNCTSQDPPCYGER
jgi:hypothetical protein